MARASISSSDPVSSYMDGVNVKIAEGYKPPRKVTLPAAYNNKFPDITRYNYDFDVERSILNKLEEWRKARKENNELREQRIEERKKRDQDEEVTKSNSPSSPEVPLPVKVAPAPKTTILTPQPLSPPCDLQDIDLNVKSNGLDYADFDNDTSSPFDNMELKTINDMEELAQVLQPTSQWVPPVRIENILKELTLEEKINESDCNNDTEISNKVEDNNDNLNNNFETKRRNISIIVEELERELKRPHMENWKPWPDLESPVSKNLSSEESSANVESLSDEDKKLAKHLSDMGFPLSRAAKAIGDLGGKDNKKVVEYLLAVQCLEELGLAGDDAEKALALNDYDQEKAKKYHDNLCTLKDLGFEEDEASKALLKCDIDRDKALDYLCA